MSSKKDPRLFLRLTFDFIDSPKIERLTADALRVLMRMMSYSARYLTDGVLEDEIMHKFTPRHSAEDAAALLAELASNHPERPSLVRIDGGWFIHDFTEHNPTRADVERWRAAGAKAGRASAAKRAQAHSGQTELSGIPGEEPKPKPKARAAGTTKRGTRLPDQFWVTSEMRQWAAEEVPGLDIDAHTRAFADYWRGAPGAKGVKLDWVATWRNWMRREHRRTVPGAPGARLTNEEKNLQQFQARYGGGSMPALEGVDHG